jgi:broad specificity phosphatase PhoE
VADIGAVHWDRWRGDLDFAPPGGESLRSLGNRVREACADLATAAVDETVVVVTHVSPLKAAVAWALGVGDDVSWRCFVAPASITRVRLTLAGPTLVSFNEAGHLAGVGPSGNW